MEGGEEAGKLGGVEAGEDGLLVGGVGVQEDE